MERFTLKRKGVAGALADKLATAEPPAAIPTLTITAGSKVTQTLFISCMEDPNRGLFYGHWVIYSSDTGGDRAIHMYHIITKG